MACASSVSAAAVATCVAPGVAHTKSRTSVVSGSKGLVLASSPSKSFSSMVVANKSRVTMRYTSVFLIVFQFSSRHPPLYDIFCFFCSKWNCVGLPVTCIVCYCNLVGLR